MHIKILSRAHKFLLQISTYSANPRQARHVCLHVLCTHTVAVNKKLTFHCVSTIVWTHYAIRFHTVPRNTHTGMHTSVLDYRRTGAVGSKMVTPAQCSTNVRNRNVDNSGVKTMVYTQRTRNSVSSSLHIEASRLQPS